jgi:hypothetical protein
MVMVMKVVMAMVMIKCSGLEKKEEKNKKLKAKVISTGAFYVLVIKRLSVCDHV